MTTAVLNLESMHKKTQEKRIQLFQQFLLRTRKFLYQSLQKISLGHLFIVEQALMGRGALFADWLRPGVPEPIIVKKHGMPLRLIDPSWEEATPFVCLCKALALRPTGLAQPFHALKSQKRRDGELFTRGTA